MSQDNLFGYGEWWEELWKGMPEFTQRELKPLHSLQVDFHNLDHVAEFEKRLGGRIYHGKWMWYPPKEYGAWREFRYVCNPPVQPRYPVYVISKGRWESRLTSKSLDALGIPYHICVEPQEYDAYAAVMDPRKILTLPFSNLGQGSIPARNWLWEHSIAEGFERHWCLDDNIQGFYRLHNNSKIQTNCGVMFRAAEDYVDRYENVGIAGFQYESFAMRREKLPPMYMNTRVYSCILIKNDIPYRWRGRYNEDTDLSLRALKDGWCTILFIAFLANKIATMKMTGGNTDELYKGDGRLKMAQSLVDQHPDVTKIVFKWGRHQHDVNYDSFKKNSLRLRPGTVIPDGFNNYGMELTRVSPEARAA